MDEAPATEAAAAVERLLGGRCAEWRHAAGGYTPAGRWIVTLEDGRSAFAKVGTTPLTAGWLRIEARSYRELQGPFLPEMYGFEDGDEPVLVLEDLSAAHWPPPWDSQRVERMMATIRSIGERPAPEWARSSDELTRVFGAWSFVAKDPAPFLSLGLCSERWLEHALPVLIEHQRPPEAAGDRMLHFDVRSDNMCFAGERTLLVDWNWVTAGNALFDVAAWLPSLQFEGGPAPEEVCEEAGVFAAALAGYFGAMAGLPGIPDAPRVRTVQRQQLSTALPWAVRVLGLPALDGPNAPA